MPKNLRRGDRVLLKTFGRWVPAIFLWKLQDRSRHPDLFVCVPRKFGESMHSAYRNEVRAWPKRST